VISAEEYLATSYDPDVEYVDGELVKRTGGETRHGRSRSRKRLAYVHTAAGMTKAEGGILKTADPEIIVPLATVWPKWAQR